MIFLVVVDALVAPQRCAVTRHYAMADVLGRVKLDLPFLAQGEAPAANKVNIPEAVARVLNRADPRVPETPERVRAVRLRAKEAADQALTAGQVEGDQWWASPPALRATTDDPLGVVIVGGGLAGLVTAAACHSRGMRVAVFEQARSYAPYGGPIQIQSNALRAIEQIDKRIFDDLVAAGTCTADRVSGLKIGYRRGNKLAGLYDRGDWLVRFDTVGPALDAGLPRTVVVDRPVIQQIFVKYLPKDTVKIRSRLLNYEETDDYVKAQFEDGSQAYGDVLVGADGVWSTVRKQLHDLPSGAVGTAASGAAGGALDDEEARQAARETARIAAQASRRYSGFTCYAGLCEHKASNIEDVSYQILLGSSKYFVSTDAGGDRQQWFALVREDAGGVDPSPTSTAPTPKKDRLAREFRHTAPGDADSNVWDTFALELVNATNEIDVKRRDLYDGPPLLRDPTKWLAPWSSRRVALCGDAAHPMMPNLGQGGCQSTEDGYRLAAELAKSATSMPQQALASYSRQRAVRTAIVQGLAQLGSDLLVDFDLMMTIPLVGPFFLRATQLTMPLILAFLYVPNF